MMHFPSNCVRESVRISSPTSGTSSATLPRCLTQFLRDGKSKVDQTTNIEAADMIVVLIISIKKINSPGRIDPFFGIFLGLVFFVLGGRNQTNGLEHLVFFSS